MNTSVPGRGKKIAFLDEFIAAGESVLRGMVLVRPTYAVAYASIRQADGTFRITHRGTGMYDYFFDTLIVHDPWEVERHERLLARRFKLDSPRIHPDVRYFDDPDGALAALTALPADI